MEFDLIETEYLKNSKFSPYFRFIAGIAAIFLFLNSLNYNVFLDNKIIEILSTAFICVFFITQILNNALFSRIGTIVFGDEIRVIKKGKRKSEIQLSNIRNVKIEKVQNNHYLIDASPFYKEVVELKADDLTELKQYFKDRKINYDVKSIINWIKKLFK